MFNVINGLSARLRNRHTLRAHAWQSAAFYAQQGFGLIFGIILARLLTPADFGAFGFAMASVFLALLPATWSLAPNLLADAGKTPSLHTVTASFGWCVVFVRLAIVACVCIWFFSQGQIQTAILCLMAGFTESWRELNNIQRAYLESMGNFKPNLVSAVLGIVFSLGIVLPVSLLGLGPFTLALPGLGGLVMDFLIYRHYSGKSVFAKPAWNIGRNFLRKGFWLWLNSASEVALARLDSWFIGKYNGNNMLGDYNRAFGYAPISHMLLSSFLGNPTLVGLTRCANAASRRRLLLRTGAIVVSGGLANWAVFFFFARPIVLFIFGSKWEGAIPIFQAFASLSFVYALALMPVTLLLSARRYRELAQVRVVCVTMFAVTLFFLPGTRSATSVAWLVQATLLLQGVALLIPCWSLLTDDPHRESAPCTT